MLCSWSFDTLRSRWTLVFHFELRFWTQEDRTLSEFWLWRHFSISKGWNYVWHSGWCSFAKRIWHNCVTKPFSFQCTYKCTELQCFQQQKINVDLHSSWQMSLRKVTNSLKIVNQSYATPCYTGSLQPTFDLHKISDRPKQNSWAKELLR